MHPSGPDGRTPRLRTTIACVICRRRKTRCVTFEYPPSTPCKRCGEKGLVCEYVTVPEYFNSGPPLPQNPPQPVYGAYPGSQSYSTSGHRYPAIGQLEPPASAYASPLPYTLPPPTYARPRYAGSEYPDLSLSAASAPQTRHNAGFGGYIAGEAMNMDMGAGDNDGNNVDTADMTQQPGSYPPDYYGAGGQASGLLLPISVPNHPPTLHVQRCFARGLSISEEGSSSPLRNRTKICRRGQPSRPRRVFLIPSVDPGLACAERRSVETDGTFDGTDGTNALRSHKSRLRRCFDGIATRDAAKAFRRSGKIQSVPSGGNDSPNSLGKKGWRKSLLRVSLPARILPAAEINLELKKEAEEGAFRNAALSPSDAETTSFAVFFLGIPKSQLTYLVLEDHPTSCKLVPLHSPKIRPTRHLLPAVRVVVVKIQCERPLRSVRLQPGTICERRTRYCLGGALYLASETYPSERRRSIISPSSGGRDYRTRSSSTWPWSSTEAPVRRKDLQFGSL
ncbi:hypothetical protein C8F01DRAFT_1295700 [Mycena amicta]|nr:hypothetical protein C8F01DRAFT_1295700 [Mycena amicta]